MVMEVNLRTVWTAGRALLTVAGALGAVLKRMEVARPTAFNILPQLIRILVSPIKVRSWDWNTRTVGGKWVERQDGEKPSPADIQLKYILDSLYYLKRPKS